MFWESFKITGLAVAQSFLLGAIGFFLVKKHLLTSEGLSALSRLVVEVTLPALVFCQLVKDFTFSLYPGWWIFLLLSLGITAIGLLLGAGLMRFVKGRQYQLQFLSLITFQNSGYLPLALLTALLPGEKLGTMLIYLFLFLAGFNLVIFSLGTYILSLHENKKFELASVFSPPVIATVIGLAVIALGIDKFIPQLALKPLGLVGNCTLPLAMFVVGGSLAEIRLVKIDKGAMILMSLVKLIIMPALGILFIMRFKLPELVGLLIVMELAMPPATFLSVITRHYKKEDLLISQGILLGHIISIVTIPLFLSLYFILNVVK